MQIKLSAICVLFMCFGQLYAGTITYYRKNYKSVADHLMRDHGHNAIIRVPMDNISTYLPEGHPIKRRTIVRMSERKIPGKTPLAIIRHYLGKKEIQQTGSAKSLFASLEEDTPHTYVILDNGLTFTESTEYIRKTNLKDIFTKHFLISNFAKNVLYSGEIYIYKNPANNEIFVIFDNSSGTYQPQSKYLANLQELLDRTFNSPEDSQTERVYFITKNFNQRVIKQKLFAHEENPFFTM